MKRRDLLKLMPTAFTMHLAWFGQQAGAGVDVAANRKIILFINENVIPAHMFSDMFKDSNLDVVVCPVSVPEGKTIDDVIRLYQITGN